MRKFHFLVKKADLTMKRVQLKNLEEENVKLWKENEEYDHKCLLFFKFFE